MEYPRRADGFPPWPRNGSIAATPRRRDVDKSAETSRGAAAGSRPARFPRYAIDGDRCKLWHGGHHSDFGEPWEPGDVVGFLLDLVNLEMNFSVNGDVLVSGVPEGFEYAFSGVSGDGGWFPALTMKSGLLRVNFGDHDFEYPPPDTDDGAPFHAVALSEVHQAG